MSREKKVGGTGVCTRCGRRHPKGKKARAKALKAGTWGGCVMQKRDVVKTADKWTGKDKENRDAKNTQIHDRNVERQKQRRQEANARNKKYREQFASLQEELDYCLKVGGRSKQVRKLKERINAQNKKEK